MTRRTLIAAGGAILATAAVAGAFWPGAGPGIPADPPSAVVESETAPITEGSGQGDTVVGATRSLSAAVPQASEGTDTDIGSSVYRSLAPEVVTPVQQATGTLCETSSGSCVVPPQPIGSPCRCGEGDTAMIGEITR